MAEQNNKNEDLENIISLFSQELQVINMGLASFAENLRENNVTVVDLDWSPPAGGDEELISILDSISD